MRHQQEPYFPGDITIQLILSRGSSHGKKEQNEPRNAYLEEHLEVQDAKHARVELRAHKKVVNGEARHAMLSPTCQGRDVRNHRDNDPGNDGHAHDRPELVHDGVQLEEAREVQNETQADARVEGPHGRAVVVELLPTHMR